jgi:hypothetical protein
VETYQYKGVKLMPSVAEKLVVEFLSSHEMGRRNDLINFAVSEHKKRGGSMIDVEPIPCIKKALKTLKQRGVIETPAYGLYKLINTSSQPNTVPETGLSTTASKESDNQLTPESIHGNGSNCVYVYYYPAYRELAEAKGETRWLCKIGLSTVEASMRVNQQSGTSMPEKPVIALEFKTENPSELEKAIHSMLSIRGQKSAPSPGQEWFNTNPNEVKTIYDFIINVASPVAVTPK